MLGLSAAGAAALLGGAAVGRATAGIGPAGLGPLGGSGAGHAAPTTAYPFEGAHQAGITTPVQDHLHFAAFDLSSRATRDDVVELLQDWTYAASRLTQGLDVSATGALDGPESAPPDDTGEALDLPASGLTVTIGLGPTLFELDGEDRFGIAARRPAALAPLPPFLGDALSTEWSHGDLCLQACADDPQVAVHAIRNLARIAFGRAHVRWSQMGFGRTSKTSAAQATPRNLFGFKDGTDNILGTEEDRLAEHVWVAPGSATAGAGDAADWLAGGSYLVSRKIEMLLEPWDRTGLGEQERVFGRDKRVGAPLSGGDEFTAPVFGDGRIDIASHVHLAHPTNNAGATMLRRGYNYVDGTNPLGRLDAGLFFLAYVNDPDTFVQVQRSLSTDLLNEYIRHIGSAIFAVPPGIEPGGWVGETLFA
ncbi:deferrochelatase/peroxidase EfeB [Salana multivorans]|uniref:Deferrochelatase n=1 Tax=Salana multivorans TaxID=120377 RepID=A0A3N2D0Z7_9MICO|nr:deferrochelatase/peroxidase EfeB [Salana multivorans]